jgi:hypothetical protein
MAAMLLILCLKVLEPIGQSSYFTLREDLHVVSPTCRQLFKAAMIISAQTRAARNIYLLRSMVALQAYCQGMWQRTHISSIGLASHHIYVL